MINRKVVKCVSLCSLTLMLLLQSACSSLLPNKGETLIEQSDNSAIQTNSEQGTEGTQKPKKPLLDALNLKTATGADYDKSTLRGNSVFVTFWSTNCQYCETELLLLETISKNIDNKKLQFLLINAPDSEETAETAETYLRKRKINLPLAFMSREDCFRLGIPGFPFNFILNKEGDLTELRLGKGSTKFFFGTTEEQLKDYIKQIVEG